LSSSTERADEVGKLLKYADDMAAKPVMTAEEWFEGMRAASPPKEDDVTILWDGRRIDSREAALAWLAEIEIARASDPSAWPQSLKVTSVPMHRDDVSPAGLSEGWGPQVVEPLGELFLHPAKQASVDTKRDNRIGMAHSLGDRKQVRALIATRESLDNGVQ
jgi:hypothetical protein